MNQQEIFDFVYHAIVKQGEPSATSSGSCRYRGPRGLKCAVGHLLSDEDYTPEIEGHSVLNALIAVKDFQWPEPINSNLYLMQSIQEAHDYSISMGIDFIDQFTKEMSNVADEYGLIMPQ